MHITTTLFATASSLVVIIYIYRSIVAGNANHHQVHDDVAAACYDDLLKVMDSIPQRLPIILHAYYCQVPSKDKPKNQIIMSTVAGETNSSHLQRWTTVPDPRYYFSSRDIYIAMQMMKRYRFVSTGRRKTFYPHEFHNRENISFPESSCSKRGKLLEYPLMKRYPSPSKGPLRPDEDQFAQNNVIKGNAGMFRIIVDHELGLCGVAFHSVGGRFYRKACSCIGCSTM